MPSLQRYSAAMGSCHAIENMRERGFQQRSVSLCSDICVPVTGHALVSFYLTVDMVADISRSVMFSFLICVGSNLRCFISHITVANVPVSSIGHAGEAWGSDSCPDGVAPHSGEKGGWLQAHHRPLPHP